MGYQKERCSFNYGNQFFTKTMSRPGILNDQSFSLHKVNFIKIHPTTKK